jgi:lysophospholipase L1-like esterase
MKRNLLVVAIGAVLAMILALAPGTASAEDDDGVYLSLGTSLAAGTIADAGGNNILFSDRSYTDRLAATFDHLDHVKLGCPGETVATFTHGGICYTGDVSQLSLARATLAAGDVQLVTIDLGANDFLQAAPDIVACGDDPYCVFAILNGIAADIGGVLDALQDADPHVQIVGMNYYNPNLAAWVGHFPGVPIQLDPDLGTAMASNALSQLGNDLIEAQFAARGLLIADIEAEFSGTDFGDTDSDGIPNNVETICAWTSMCPDTNGAFPNIHPNDDGYDRIGDAFEKLISDTNE